MIDRETELREQLAALRRRYQDEAQPIVDELTKIEAMKPPKPIMVYADLLPGQLACAPQLPDRHGQPVLREVVP